MPSMTTAPRRHTPRSAPPPDISKPLNVALQVIDQLLDHVKDLNERVKVLERRPEVKWAGVHVPEREYTPGNLVTRHGGLWLALVTTRDGPGNSASAWRLIVKEGRAHG